MKDEELGGLEVQLTVVGGQVKWDITKDPKPKLGRRIGDNDERGGQ